MKKISISSLLIVIAVLQGCATTVNPQKKTSSQLIDGSEKLMLSSKTCPRGIGMVRLLKNTYNGDKVGINAKFFPTSKPIDQDFNIYNLIGESDGSGKSAPKAELLQSDNAIKLLLSDKTVTVAPKTKTKMGNATSMLKSESAEPVVLGVPFGVQYDPKRKYYSISQYVSEHVALSPGEIPLPEQKIVTSVYVKINKGFTAFPIPESIDDSSLDNHFDEKFSPKAGEPLVINIHPKTSENEGKLYVQIYSGADKSGAGNYYNYITNDAPGLAEIKVPVSKIAPGDYHMNIIRTEVFYADASGDETEATAAADASANGANTFCIETGTGAIGSVSIPAPEKK